jgi:hypothetical protein
VARKLLPDGRVVQPEGVTLRGPCLIAACAAAVLVSACRDAQPVPDQRTHTIAGDEELRAARSGWPAGVAALVDSANAAYSAQDYGRASMLYREAAQRAPDLRVVWFGIYIAEHARGNLPAADSALARAQTSQ